MKILVYVAFANQDGIGRFAGLVRVGLCDRNLLKISRFTLIVVEGVQLNLCAGSFIVSFKK